MNFHIPKESLPVLAGKVGLVTGIGEHAPEIRRRVCDNSAWLGIILSADANQRGDECISAPESRLSVWVIPTDEERTIARQTIAALGAKNATSSFNATMVHP